MPFWLKSKASALDVNRESTQQKLLRMQEEHAEVEEEPPHYRIPLPRILAWNRWWHITARLIVIVYKKRFWGLVGGYLQTVKGIPSCRLAILRANWSAIGRELKHLAAKEAIISSRWEAPLHSTL